MKIEELLESTPKRVTLRQLEKSDSLNGAQSGSFRLRIDGPMKALVNHWNSKGSDRIGQIMAEPGDYFKGSAYISVPTIASAGKVLYRVKGDEVRASLPTQKIEDANRMDAADPGYRGETYFPLIPDGKSQSTDNIIWFPVSKLVGKAILLANHVPKKMKSLATAQVDHLIADVAAFMKKSKVTRDYADDMFEYAQDVTGKAMGLDDPVQDLKDGDIEKFGDYVEKKIFDPAAKMSGVDPSKFEL